MRSLSDPMFWLAVIIALLQGQSFVDRWRQKRIKIDVGTKATEQALNRELRQLTAEVRQLADKFDEARKRWHEINNTVTRLVGEMGVRNEQHRRDLDRIDKAVDDLWAHRDLRRVQGT